MSSDLIDITGHGFGKSLKKFQQNDRVISMEVSIKDPLTRYGRMDGWINGWMGWDGPMRTVLSY